MQAVQSSQAGGSLLYSSSIGHYTTEYGVLSAPKFTKSTPLPMFNGSAHSVPNLSKTQLPTPVTSDIPMEAIERSSYQPGLKTLRVDSGDLDESIHEDDDDDMVELAERIEKSTRSEGASPPARARKFNIRETHEYDDYGGALFTEQERELLGESTHRSISAT